MANKYSKSNTRKDEAKTMADYEKSRQRLNKGARIMAIIMAAVMVIFAFVGAVSFMM